MARITAGRDQRELENAVSPPGSLSSLGNRTNAGSPPGGLSSLGNRTRGPESPSDQAIPAKRPRRQRAPAPSGDQSQPITIDSQGSELSPEGFVQKEIEDIRGELESGAYRLKKDFDKAEKTLNKHATDKANPVDVQMSAGLLRDQIAAQREFSCMSRAKTTTTDQVRIIKNHLGFGNIVSKPVFTKCLSDYFSHLFENASISEVTKSLEGSSQPHARNPSTKPCEICSKHTENLNLISGQQNHLTSS